jgi:sugar/nucleoside kinase (ribokinase family)
MRFLRINEQSPYRQLIGIGGLGTGIFFELESDSTLGRNESRLGSILDVRDYCKLHIVIHYVARLLNAHPSGSPFHVIPVGKVGEDAPGQRVLRDMSDVGIDISHVAALPGSPTLFSVCFQYPDGSGGNLTTNNSAAGSLSTNDIDKLAYLFAAKPGRTIALAVPEVPLETRRYFLKLATDAGAFRAASFAAAEVGKARDAGMFNLLDLAALNEGEAEEFVGSPFSPVSPELFVKKCQELLRHSYPHVKLILTAGKIGAYGITAQEYNFCPAHEVEVASTAGAGDSLLGGVLAALSVGIPFMTVDSSATHPHGALQTAVDLGVLLGSYKCLSPHTIHPDASIDTLLEFAQGRHVRISPRVQDLVVKAACPQVAD